MTLLCPRGSKTGARKTATGASESSYETHETHGKERETETDTEKEQSR